MKNKMDNTQYFDTDSYSQKRSSIMPKKYYKYRALYQNDGKPNPFTRSIFENAEIYYSSPQHINDPFDCNLRLHAEGSSDQEWESYFKKLIQDCPTKAVEINKAIKQKLWLKDPQFRKRVGASTHKTIYEESSIFCLSRKNDSIPMFSYYADNHKGIAIEFEFSDFELPCGIEYDKLTGKVINSNGSIVFDDVHYLSNFPELNYHRLRDSNKMIPSLIFAKYEEWIHEKEFRIFRHKVPASSAKFDKRIVKRIIFGCKTDDRDVELVKSWLANWPSNIVLSKATKNISNFKLDIVDLDIIIGSCV
jgi:hypothetical protein